MCVCEELCKTEGSTVGCALVWLMSADRYVHVSCCFVVAVCVSRASPYAHIMAAVASIAALVTMSELVWSVATAPASAAGRLTSVVGQDG